MIGILQTLWGWFAGGEPTDTRGLCAVSDAARYGCTVSDALRYGCTVSDARYYGVAVGDSAP